MKNYVNRFGFFMLIMLFASSAVFAQPGQPHKKPPKAKAHKILNETAKTIHHARIAVKEGKVFTGDLAAAVKHQKYAKKLYSQAKYKKSIEHSIYAKKRAIKAIKANKKPVGAENTNLPESGMPGPKTSDADLESEVADIDDESEETIVETESLDLEVVE